MNEIHLIATKDNGGIAFETTRLVYKNDEKDSILTPIDANIYQVLQEQNHLSTSVFFSSAVNSGSYMAAMYKSITTRNLYFTSEEMSKLQVTMGKKNIDDRFLIGAIITTITYKNNKYNFSQYQYVGGTC